METEKEEMVENKERNKRRMEIREGDKVAKTRVQDKEELTHKLTRTKRRDDIDKGIKRDQEKRNNRGRENK